MTLITDIIRRALRECNTITIGQSLPDNERDEALERLQSLVSSIYGNEVGENLEPWPLGNYGRSTQSRMTVSEQCLIYPVQNSRLVAVNELAQTVYLPVDPSDGARIGIVDPLSRLATVPITLDGNGRAIEGAANVVLSTNGLTTVWRYSAETGNWAKLNSLTVTDALPFPEEFDDYFIISLAMRTNPAYGKSIDQQSLARLKDQKRQLIARYVQSAPLHINPDISFPTLQSYRNFADMWFGGGTTDYFNRGGFFGGSY